MRQLIFFLFTISFAFSSCVSSEKLVDQGDYDQAIELAIRKLAGKKNKKPDNVQALEEAFAKVTQYDLNRAERLQLNPSGANWDRVYNIYRTIRKRQELIEPLLPIVDKHGIKANFKFIQTQTLELEAKRNAVSTYYSSAQNALNLARTGDKAAARSAYQDLKNIEKYYQNYRDKTQLKAEASQLGISHVFIRTKNETGAIMPAGFERELMNFGLSSLNSKWKIFHTRKHSNIEYDYEVLLSLTGLEVSPGLIQEKIYEDSKEIEDGFDYVLDENGNVMKDTLGNDIKIVRTIIVKANVVETYLNKAARVNGFIELFDLKTGRLLESKPFGGESVFEHYTSAYEGDRRALSSRSRKYCDVRPIPFPSDEFLVLDAAEQIKPVIRKKLARNTLIF